MDGENYQSKLEVGTRPLDVPQWSNTRYRTRYFVFSQITYEGIDWPPV